MSILIKDTNKEDLQRALLTFSGHEIVELLDHGDLIDRDALIENSGVCVSDFGTPDEQWRPDRDWYLGINAQTIIIPAERSEE